MSTPPHDNAEPKPRVKPELDAEPFRPEPIGLSPTEVMRIIRAEKAAEEHRLASRKKRGKRKAD